MEFMLPILLWVIIFGAIVYQAFIKKSKNRNAAQNGEDKQRIRQAVEPLLREAGNCLLVYAHWEEQESFVRTVRTTYYRYAVVFQNGSLWAGISIFGAIMGILLHP